MKKLWLLLVAVLFVVGCNGNEKVGEADSGKPLIVATTGQVADAVKNIGGEHVEVKSLMGPGVDPHLYKATQGDIQLLEDADMIFYNGLELEGKMSEIFEKMKKDKAVVALGAALPEDQLLEDPDYPGQFDPHIWFDIQLWKQASEEITKTLISEIKNHEEYFQNNEAAYFKELDSLKEWTQERMSEIPESQRVLVTAHDAFNYFGNSNGIEVRGLQGLSTESEYGIKDIQNVVDFLVAQNIKAVFIESSVSDKAMNSVIEGAKEQGHSIKIGGELFSDAMGPDGTEESTYIGMYKHNVNTIVDSLK